MHIKFYGDEQQNRWARSRGLQEQGQQEIICPTPWSPDDPRDRFIASVFQFIEHYIASQPRRITTGQTLRYGWTTLRFTDHAYSNTGISMETLLLTELQHPFSDDEPAFVPGISNTYALMELQNAAMRRNHISSEVDYPHRSQSAIVCTRIRPETIGSTSPIMAHRAWESETRTSGWFIGCTDDSHDHNNPANLANVHLLHLVQSLPALFPYLALSTGYMLLFESKQTIIFHPEQPEGQPDEGPMLTTLVDIE